MLSFELILVLVSAVFTAVVVGYLFYVLWSVSRKLGDPELAARGMREAPYHLLRREKNSR
jgi:heme/copper-type cytochrome/quinol oxidase subunit 2